MPVAWPAEVPEHVLHDSYREEPERNVSSFDTEFGPPLESRATTVATTLIDAQYWLTKTEHDALLDFYVNDLADGVLPFTRTHPSSGVAGTTMKFREPPKLEQMAGRRDTGYRLVSMKFRVLP